MSGSTIWCVPGLRELDVLGRSGLTAAGGAGYRKFCASPEHPAHAPAHAISWNHSSNRCQAGAVHHLLALVIGVGLVDSMNPTTLVPGIYLAAGKNPVKALGGFIVGFFAVNLAAGILVALGPGKYLLDLFPHPGTEAKHLIEITAGGILIVLAGILWIKRQSVAKHVSNTDRLQKSSIVVGAGIAIVEFPTAIPYLAVIAALVESGESIPTQILLLVLFNFCFLLPLFLILGARILAGDRARRWLERIKASVDRFLATLVPGLVLLVGLVVLAIGVYGIVGDKT